MYDEYLSRIGEAAKKTVFSVEAFYFVVDVVSRTLEERSGTQQLSASALCWIFRDHAIKMFGVNAKDQLASWRVDSTSDFGLIVYALIEEGLLFKSENDSFEQFHKVYEFDEAFDPDWRPDVGKVQWNLSTIFILTSLAAIVFAGVGRLGIAGGAATLFSSWLALIGLSCIYLGLTEKEHGWVAAVGIGIVFVAMGMGGFLMIILQ
jgi:uncharacterized repeat protein (TIGR04138 family)